jgi:oligopeptide transport system substrate-binding protein
VDSTTVDGGPDRTPDRGARRPKVIYHGGLVAGRLTPARPHRHSRTLALVAAVAVAATTIVNAGPRPATAAGPDEVTILLGAPTTIDPAAQGDVGSAAVSAQLFESLTAFDPGLRIRPALAASWDSSDDGRRIVFHLRPDLTFSDGTPLTGRDVVRSWLRLIDPAAPSPLASLVLDIKGAAAYLRGHATAAEVGLTATDRDVTVELVRPASDFPSIVAGPSFAVVPPELAHAGPINATGFVGSGAYVPSAVTGRELTLTGNDRYWAGPAPIRTVHLVGDIGGRSAVDAFVAGDIDYTGVSDFDASWIRFDEKLGPQLRTVPSLSLQYLGFDASRPPFDDVRVRQAFGQAVNWRRIVTLGSRTAVPATGMVPPGIPGRSEADYLPTFDPAAARAALAAAGFPGGRGFPAVTFVDPHFSVAGAVQSEVKRELGIDLRVESMDFDPYFVRLAADPPAIWTLSWVADYPGPNDFLRVLLGTGQTNNYGRWTSPDFDKAIADADDATDAGSAAAAYDRAQRVVQRDVPAVPLSYGPGWALSRTGLLGAGQNGMGILRLASLAWGKR